MRYISIDLSSDNHLQQPKIFGGYAGEHNETILCVKLPQRMIEIECSGYRFDFQTSEDNKISSQLIPVSELNDDVLSFHLIEQLTIAGNLLFNVVAISSNENTVSLVSKTNTVVLYIEDSPEGNIQLINTNGYKDELQKMVDERILEIYSAKVDQIYNPKSENAQSGKAVAEALADFEPSIDVNQLVGKETAEGGEIFNDYEGNYALSTHASAKGSGTVAGIRGFEIIETVRTSAKNGYYTISVPEGVNLQEYLQYIDLSKTVYVSVLLGDTSYFNAGYISNTPEINGTTAKIYVTTDNYEDFISTNNVVKGAAYLVLNDYPMFGIDIGMDSSAEGYHTMAIGPYSHAEGINTKSFHAASHSEGVDTIARGKGSHAEGCESEATTYATHAEGILTKATLEGAHAEGNQTVASGSYSHAEGSETNAVAYASHAEGHSAVASGAQAHAEGYGATASGASAHAEGNSTTASGESAHAEGNSTKALHNNSHAEGISTTAEAFAGHAEGGKTSVTGGYGHAEGFDTKVTGKAAHAEGAGNKATGYASHAEGGYVDDGDNVLAFNEASGIGSHAEGIGTKATMWASHAGGQGTIASANCQTAIGQFNKETDALFVVGNGSDENNRSNIFEVKPDGTLIIGEAVLSPAKLKNLIALL